jgi:hypothetical protein
LKKLSDSSDNFYNTYPQPQNPNLRYFHDHFVKVIKSGLIPFLSSVPVAHSLIIQLKSATFLFNDIQAQNIVVAKYFINLSIKMKDFHQQLKNNTERLINYQ